MAFRVDLPLDPNVPPAMLPADLRPVHGPIDPLIQTGATRELVLFEGMDPYGRLMPMLGTVQDGALLWDDPITENPMLDDVEVWEVYKGTMDAHPIHLHLVSFQIVDRQRFKADQDMMMGSLANIRLIGQPKGPAPEEAGWKDTAIMYPGEVTRVIAHFDRPGFYAWHCHILSHEDHEMMRPYFVGPVLLAGSEPAGPREVRLATELDGPAEPYFLKEPAVSMPAGVNFALGAVAPNPFAGSTSVGFRLANDAHVQASIYDPAGRLVRVLTDGSFSAGDHVLQWDQQDDRGQRVGQGMYFYRMQTGDAVAERRLVVIE